MPESALKRPAAKNAHTTIDEGSRENESLTEEIRCLPNSFMAPKFVLWPCVSVTRSEANQSRCTPRWNARQAARSAPGSESRERCWDQTVGAAECRTPRPTTYKACSAAEEQSGRQQNA